jgi:hypothetical protein
LIASAHVSARGKAQTDVPYLYADKKEVLVRFHGSTHTIFSLITRRLLRNDSRPDNHELWPHDGYASFFHKRSFENALGYNPKTIQ